MMKPMRLPCFRRFLRCAQGVSAMEFALIFPLMLFIFIAGTEIARFTMLQQKLEKTASTLADLTTQEAEISQTSLNEIAASAATMMKPFAFGAANATVIFTSVEAVSAPTAQCRTPQVNCLRWQVRPYGTHSSRLFDPPSFPNAPGSRPLLPNGYAVPAGSDVIVAEVIYEFKPIFEFTDSIVSVGNISLAVPLRARTLNYTAILRPRQDALTTLKP